MKKLILILTAAIFVVSCSDNLDDLNQNIKDPSSVSGESLFAGAQKQLADQMTTPNVNLNNNRLWAQHWNETTYQDESNYDQVTRSIPDNHWREMYRDVLKNLDEAAKVIEATDNDLTNAQKPNKLAIIEILSIYAWSNMVETYGDIPYTEALDIDNTLPAYDDAFTVYKDLLRRLNEAIASMDSQPAFTSSQDLIYAGDITSWTKFGNTLKLRMGMMIADVDPALSRTTVETAVSSPAGVFTSNADDANYQYSSTAPNNNPVHDNLVLSGRNDYVAAQTIIDIMNGINDPRRASYFDPNLNETVGIVDNVSTTGGVTTIVFTEPITVSPIVGNNVYLPNELDPEYPTRLGTIDAVGGNSIDMIYVRVTPEPGDEVFYAMYAGALPGKQSRYTDFSHANRTMVEPTNPGILLSNIETKFLLAEGAARGYNVGGTAKDHYDAGITASFELWDESGLAEYLAQADVDYDSAITTSGSDPKWKEVIGTQAWLGLYNRSFAVYLSIRRLDYPLLMEPEAKKSGYPTRYTYPVSEQNLNGTNYSAAASAIGGDLPTTRLFWDKFYTFDF